MNTERSHRHTDIARLRELARSPRARHAARRCVVEGPKLIREAITARHQIIQVIHTSAADTTTTPAATTARSALAARELLDQLGPETEITLVTQRAIERVATTKSPQPIIAEVEIAPSDWSVLDDIETPAVLVAVDINDPGNLGTLMRSARANGFDAVITTGDTTDAYSPKVIRASAGTIFTTPLITTELETTFTELRERSITTVGTAMINATDCDQLDLTRPIALFLGNEANGLDPNLPLDIWTTIPMADVTESLNVAMAGTILSYELARQRRQNGKDGPHSRRPHSRHGQDGHAQRYIDN